MKSYPVLALKSTFFSEKLLKSGFSEGGGGPPPRGGVHVITQMRQPSDVSLYFPDLSPMGGGGGSGIPAARLDTVAVRVKGEGGQCVVGMVCIELDGSTENK